MERVKELLENSMDFEKKLAVIQRSKAIVDTQNGLTEEVELSLTEEALPADEFVEAFGAFYNEWVSYYYLERIIDEENVLDYGKLGKFPLIVV